MNNEKDYAAAFWIFGSFVAICLVALLMWGVPSYGRYQRLQNERNQVTINDIQIQQTEQLVEVQKQKAQIAIEEAKGISMELLLPCTFSMRLSKHRKIK